MHIQELILQTQHPAKQKEFYNKMLGLPLLAETDAEFTIQVGTTRLSFQKTQQDVLYHVAFTLPRDTFSQAKGWLGERLSLLDKNGEDEFFFANIDARSFYFYDADKNILEYIVHYELEHEIGRPFQPTDVMHISEIGLPVEGVPEQVAFLKEKLGIEPHKSMSSEEFAFIGDIYGQLVVVKVGRPWLPTESVLAVVSPVQLTTKDQKETQLQLLPFPYTITAHAF